MAKELATKISQWERKPCYHGRGDPITMGIGTCNHKILKK